MFTMLPQFLLSGLFFPLYAMPWGVRWIGYLLPLTWFIKVARGVMVRGAPINSLWLPLLILAVMAVVVFTVSTLRFRRDLAPAGRPEGTDSAGGPEAALETAGQAARDGGSAVRYATAPAWGVRDLTVRYGRPGRAGRRHAGGAARRRGRRDRRRRRRQDDAAARARRRGRPGGREREPSGPAPHRLRGRRLRLLRRPQRRREHRLRRRRLRPPGDRSATRGSRRLLARTALTGTGRRLAGRLSGGSARSSRSRWRCCTSPTCSCLTSPPPAWTRSAGPTCGG